MSDPISDPTEFDRLAGLVERVSFHTEQNGSCVLRLKVKGERELITLIGHAPAVSPGEYASASGNLRHERAAFRQRVSPWGRQGSLLGSDDSHYGAIPPPSVR